MKSQNGYIFLCSDLTEKECLTRNLFGGMAPYESKVRKLEIGDVLYLYNFHSKILHGKFIAASKVGMNIIAEAWEGNYPVQVRVKRIRNYKPLSKVDFENEISFFNGKPKVRLSQEEIEILDKNFESSKRLQKEIIDYQKENPATLPTKDGHFVRSKAEVKIDDWLFDHRIIHVYEKKIEDTCFDFMIPTQKGDVYIEYWGMKTKGYLLQKNKKEKMYKRLKLDLISLESKDLKELNQKLARLL